MNIRNALLAIHFCKEINVYYFGNIMSQQKIDWDSRSLVHAPKFLEMSYIILMCLSLGNSHDDTLLGQIFTP